MSMHGAVCASQLIHRVCRCAALRLPCCTRTQRSDEPACAAHGADLPLASQPQTHLLRLQPRFAVWRPREDLLPALLAYIKAIFKRRTLDVLDAASAADAELFR
jgi:hypothetical protein